MSVYFVPEMNQNAKNVAERVSFDFLLGHVLYHGMRAIQADDSTELSSVVFKVKFSSREYISHKYVLLSISFTEMSFHRII